jgi:hypothetical protein
MILACQATYHPEVAALHDGIGWGADHEIVDDPKPDEDRLHIDAALVGNVPEGVLVAFRGTLPPIPRTEHSPQQIFADWLNNLKFAAREREGYPGRVHEGFSDSLERLWGSAQTPGLEAAIMRRLNAAARKRLFITGHSKGGALANLAAWRLHRTAGLDDRIRVYTIAAARSGNEAWRAAYDSEERIVCSRYESALDVVPLIPPGNDTPGWLLTLLGKRAEALLADNYVPVGRRIPASTSFADGLKVGARAFEFLVKPKLFDEYVQVLGIAHDIGSNSGYDALVCDPDCQHLPV